MKTNADVSTYRKTTVADILFDTKPNATTPAADDNQLMLFTFILTEKLMLQILLYTEY